MMQLTYAKTVTTLVWLGVIAILITSYVLVPGDINNKVMWTGLYVMIVIALSLLWLWIYLIFI